MDCRFSSFKYPTLGLVLLAVIPYVNGEEVRMAVSDLLADAINPVIERVFEEEGIDCELESIGSLPAMDRLQSNQIDLAILAIPQQSALPREDFQVYPFAYDATVVVVGEGNPLDEISLIELAGIYGISESLNFTSWGDLGLSGWGSRRIKPVSGSDEGSICLELFRNRVLFNGELKPSVDVLRNHEVEKLLYSDSAAIAVMSSIPKDENLKVLMLSRTVDSPAYGPSNDNIHFDDYPIRLAFYIVGSFSNQTVPERILQVLWSDELSGILEENGFFPLPETVRRKYQMDLNFQ